jgi:phosphoglycolate phosphatase
MTQPAGTIRNVLFDLDGTLVDSSRTISESIDYALEQVGAGTHGRVPAEEVIGLPLLDIFRDSYGMNHQVAESAIAHYREHYDSLKQAGTVIYEDVEEVLSTLKAGGLSLYIATVKPTGIAEKVLSDLHLVQHFNGVAGASMGPERRDKSSIIAHALQKFGLDPLHSLMIGDRDQDIMGARDNGMSAIAVTYGFGTEAELRSARPRQMVDRSKEIVPLVLNPSVAK